jgi:hypothetical protein
MLPCHGSGRAFFAGWAGTSILNDTWTYDIAAGQWTNRTGPGSPAAYTRGERMNPTESFRRARDFLVRHREDWEAATRGFAWPALDRFNWALDYFDTIASGNDATNLFVRNCFG